MLLLRLKCSVFILIVVQNIRKSSEILPQQPSVTACLILSAGEPRDL